MNKTDNITLLRGESIKGKTIVVWFSCGAARAGDWAKTNCDHSYEIAIRAYVAGYYDAMKGKRWK